MAMLVVPNHWNTAPIGPGTAFATQVRRWSDQGIEMFVHGWFHRDDTLHSSWRDSLRARKMTASEGEFLGLTEAEAARRMADGRALVEDIIGRRVAGFVAPAWLYGDGALRALASAGFDLAENHARVWEPRTGRTLSAGPVVTWASRSAIRAASSQVVALAARHCLGFLRTVRMAVHPGDLSRPELVRSIDLTLATLLRSRRAGRYAELLEGPL